MLRRGQPKSGSPSTTVSGAGSASTVTVWKVLVPVVALLAGLLVVTTARTAKGTDLRSAQTNLVDLVRSAESKATANDAKVKQLQSQVSTRTDQLARFDAVLARIKAGYQPLLGPSGLTSVTGPGLDVTLDDSHTPQLDPSIDPNDLVVHQSDMQAVVNSLWSGGAEAMTVMGQRIIATSAVRCVGNTLLLNGQVFSPPFRISAIGPAAQMRAALDASPNVSLYRRDARSYGLEYSVADKSGIMVAGYDAPVALTYAKAGQ